MCRKEPATSAAKEPETMTFTAAYEAFAPTFSDSIEDLDAKLVHVAALAGDHSVLIEDLYDAQDALMIEEMAQGIALSD
tara:strand:+ start:426 stop:662 length:237 start_codon:yes stop_codon:yes gene_type:complete